MYVIAPTFINITDIRSKISQIAKQTEDGDNRSIVLLKNGKPTMVLVSYEEWQQQQDFLKREKKRQALDAFSTIQTYAAKAKLADKWLKKRGIDPTTIKDDSFLDLLYEEDRKKKNNT